MVLFSQPLEFYLTYVPMVLLLPIFLKKFFIPRVPFYLFLILFLSGLFFVYQGLNTMGLFAKVFFGMFFSYVFFYGMVKAYGDDVNYLFILYLKAALVISVIGLIQFISFQFDFRPGYRFDYIINKGGPAPGGNFGIRLSGIFSEPTYYATFIAPAAFVAAHDLIRKNRFFYSKAVSLFILSIYLLTFSGNAYNGVLIIGALFLLNYGLLRYSIIGIPIIALAFYFSYENIREFRARVDSTIEIFQTGQFTIGKTHGSSVNLYDNFQVAFKNLQAHPLFGTGIGSHPIAFDKYTITKNVTQVGFAFNKQDANSMFLRTVSEMGLFGVAILLFVTFRFFVGRKPGDDPQYWIISNSILVLLILNYVRQGHYFLYGFPLYVWMYYFNWRNYRDYKQEQLALGE